MVFIRPLIALIGEFKILSTPDITELITFLNAPPTISPTAVPILLNLLNIVFTIPPKKLPTDENTFLIPSHAFLNISIMFVFRLSNIDLTLFQILTSPCFNPSIIYPPISIITLLGEAIPNAFLNPSINGLNMWSYIHLPICNIALPIPAKIPSIIFPPCSLDFSIHSPK